MSIVLIRLYIYYFFLVVDLPMVLLRTVGDLKLIALQSLHVATRTRVRLNIVSGNVHVKYSSIKKVGARFSPR